MSPHKPSRTTKAATVLGAMVLSVSFSACAQSASETGSDREASTQTNGATTTEGTADAGQDLQDENMQSTPLPSGNLLNEELNGQEAIDALGDNIDTVAKRIGKSPEELKELLLRDSSAHVTPKGFVVYRDTFPPQGR